MLSPQIQMCLSFKELLQLAARSDLNSVSPDDVSRILTEFSEGYSHSQRLDFDADGRALGSRSLRGSRFEGALLKIWELSRRQSQNDMVRRKRWKAVMATCNGLYEQLSFQRRELEAPKSTKIAA